MWETDPEGYAEFDSDRAWAACLFEGEGCLTISGVQARVKLNSTDEDVVRRFHAIVGVGQVREDDAQLKHGYKMQWEWYVGSQAGVSHFISEMYPYMGARRRERAKELLAHLESRRQLRVGRSVA